MSPADSDGTRRLAAALLRGDAIGGPHLVVTEGPEAGRRIPLSGSRTLGRGPGADVGLCDPAASRIHARFTLAEGCCRVEDLGSKNGSTVRGRRLRASRALRPGDEVVVGTTRLRLDRGLLADLPGPEAEAEAEAPSPPAPAPRDLTASWLALAGVLAGVASWLLSAG